MLLIRGGQTLNLVSRVYMLKLGRVVYETDRPAELLDATKLKSLYVA